MEPAPEAAKAPAQQPLVQSKCVPCRGGVAPLTAEEMRPLLVQVPRWRVVERDGVARIEREFTFPDFDTALQYAVRVGAIADAEDHHPDLHIGWGRVRVETWTHAIAGLHRNDFILAAKIDTMGGGEA
jgi:4a-hydroxytetrahydrobiopterin dehydratase